MKIDSAPVSRQTASSVTGGSAEARLKTGDIVEFEVISKENGVLRLKTGDGGIIRAKLDSGVVLNEGDNVKLVVIGKKNGVVHLSTDLEKIASAGEESGKALSSGTGTGDARVIARLGKLNIPIREELLGRIRELMAAHPSMTVDEAVFLAANKTSAGSELLGSMLSLLSGGAKLDNMITSLLSLLQNQAAESNATPERGGSSAAVTGAEAPINENTGIAGWVNAILGGAAGKANASAYIIAGETDEGAGAVAKGGALHIGENGEAEDTDGTVTVKAGVMASETEGRGAARFAENSIAVAPKVSSDAGIQKSAVALNENISVNNTETQTGRIMELLSGLPEFKSTPPEALRRFSGALVRAAADGVESTAKWPDDAGRLAAMIDKMFERPLREGGGDRLRQVRDELVIRLTMLEEEISRAHLPGKEAALGQAQKLVAHVRALQNIEQYVYLQLPVRLGEENTTAELFVFRQRKGVKQFDPDNVNVLLSVDLAHLGHWESLVNIRGRDVSLRMEVPNAEVSEFFSENTVKLHELLDEAGFRLSGTSISLSDEETNPLTALSSLLRFKTGSGAGIDIAV